MTLKELRDEIRSFCKDLGQDRYQAPHLNRLINIAKDEFCEDTLILLGYKEVTTMAGKERYDLADDCIAVRRVEWDSSGGTGSDFDGVQIGRVRSDMLEHVKES